MKSRSKEVNIFNMSLLDILCGALGAFCFMMLSLFPDHAKVKELQAQVQQLENQTGPGNAQQQIQEAREQARQAQQEADQARQERDKAVAEQSLAFFQIRWAEPVDIDLWLMEPGGKYYAPKKADVPPDKFADTINDVTKGPGYEQVWLVDTAHVGSIYRLFAKLTALNGQAPPAHVVGYMAARVHFKKDQSVMTFRDLGVTTLDKQGGFAELGSIEFTNDDYEFTFGPRKQAQPRTTQMLDTGGGSRLLSSPADLGIARRPARP